MGSLSEFLSEMRKTLMNEHGKTEEQVMEEAVANAQLHLGGVVEGMILVTPPCMVCGEAGEILLDAEQAERYNTLYVQQGQFIQNALPTLSAGQREQIINGTHPECFDRLFPVEEGLE